MTQPKPIHYETLTLDRVVGGGQALGTLSDGRKAFVWGGLPGESVTIRITKKKSKFVEGVVTEVHTASHERIDPIDHDNYLSTSPWQIMHFNAEQFYKAALIEEAFELHNIVLPDVIDVYSDAITEHYRNKMEFSWFGDTDAHTGLDTLDLAFFTRGGSGKYPIETSSLAHPAIIRLAHEIRDLLRTKPVGARNLKTLLIRTDQLGNCTWQLYCKDIIADIITPDEAARFSAQGGEVIYSHPQSPASVITERLASFGTIVLSDHVLGIPFRYATEGFFQVNLPVYEQALRDMQLYVNNPHVIDLYSGVGSIGLTIGGDGVTLVEINEHAVREMRENIAKLHKNATAILAPAERALEYITADATVILDPPRAGLHTDVISQLCTIKPDRIIYLSCNPVTQARDVALLAAVYGIRAHKGYNFFPRTPHIEHVVILDRIDARTT